jgi:membrane associated rhomboid family serine protease
MSAKFPANAARSPPWPPARSRLPHAGLLLAALVGAFAALPPELQRHLALARPPDGSVALLRCGTWWSAQFVHWGWMHAALDAGGLLLTGLVAERLFGPARVLLAVAGAAPLLSLGILWLEPGLVAYRGASGLVVLLGSAAWLGVWRAGGVDKRWLVLLGVTLAGKLGLEVHAALTGQPGSGLGLPAGVQVAWSAHGMGLALGLALGATLPLCRNVLRSPSIPADVNAGDR